MITRKNIKVVPTQEPYEKDPDICEINPSLNEISVSLQVLDHIAIVFDHYFDNYYHCEITATYNVNDRTVDPISICSYDEYGNYLDEYEYNLTQDESNILIDKIEEYIMAKTGNTCIETIEKAKERVY